MMTVKQTLLNNSKHLTKTIKAFYNNIRNYTSFAYLERKKDTFSQKTIQFMNLDQFAETLIVSYFREPIDISTKCTKYNYSTLRDTVPLSGVIDIREEIAINNPFSVLNDHLLSKFLQIIEQQCSGPPSVKVIVNVGRSSRVLNFYMTKIHYYPLSLDGSTVCIQKNNSILLFPCLFLRIS